MTSLQGRRTLGASKGSDQAIYLIYHEFLSKTLENLGEFGFKSMFLSSKWTCLVLTIALGSSFWGSELAI